MTDRIPSYRRHTSGQARVTLIDPVTGQRRDVLLGPYGSRSSKAEYARVIERWEALGRRHDEQDPEGLTVNELLVRYWEHVEVYYKSSLDARSNEPQNIIHALRPLKALFGDSIAAEFTPLRLKAVRQKIIDDGICRKQANARIGRIKRAFRWATENAIVPPSVYHGLQAVDGLKRGRTEARETSPVLPVPIARVEAALPFMAPPVAAVVRLQLLTAARPGELLIMRACDLDVTGRVWIYRPPQHKTLHHGKTREIYLGPRAQEIVRAWLKPDLQAYLFSPADSLEAKRDARRAGRKTPLWPSHLKAQAKKRRAKPRPVRDKYDTNSFARAIVRACDAAFPAPEPLRLMKGESLAAWMKRLTPAELAELNAWRKANRWHPHRLRHTAATLLRKEHGIEMARVILGHSSMVATELYAEFDRQSAAEVMGKIG